MSWHTPVKLKVDRFFSMSCVNLWNALPDEVVAVDSVDAFKSALHLALGPMLFEDHMKTCHPKYVDI